jgi:hypothetical protein
MPADSPTSFFDGIEQSPVSTSAGSCDLPILYRDGAVLGLMYRVAPELVEPLIPDRDTFEPFTLMGKAIVQLVVFEYRDTSIGPYNEVALAVEIQRRGSSPSTWGALVDARSQPDYGSTFLNLPVTTAAACAAGREIWGYLKYVVEIDTSFTTEKVHAVQRGEFELEVGPASWLETDGIPFVLMSRKDGRTVRTIVETGHRLKWGGAGSVKLKLLGAGPTADNLRALGLDAKTPSFVWRSYAMRSILPAGELL